VLGIWYEYAGVRQERNGKGKGIRWNWDGKRPGEVCWVWRMEIGALGGTGRRKMHNRRLRPSGRTGRRGWTLWTMRTYGAQGADAAHPDAQFMRPEQITCLG